MLLKEPILKYPDPSKPHTLFTDASKYAWTCVLTQEYEHEFDGKTKKILHPITYVSGLFKGSQVNWATLTKEAYAIYMLVKYLLVPAKYSQGHFSAPMAPMEFISMDLIGDFLPSSKGNKYALTVIAC